MKHLFLKKNLFLEAIHWTVGSSTLFMAMFSYNLLFVCSMFLSMFTNVEKYLDLNLCLAELEGMVKVKTQEIV